MLTVKHYPQTKQSACGAYVLKMILEYWGIVENLDVLIAKIEVKLGVGASHTALSQALKTYNLQVSTKSNASLSDVEKHLNKSRPVIINYISPLSGLGHYSIITGIQKDRVYMCDSSNGPKYSMSITDFNEAWFNHKRTSKHWMAVGYPADSASC